MKTKINTKNVLLAVALLLLIIIIGCGIYSHTHKYIGFHSKMSCDWDSDDSIILMQVATYKSTDGSVENRAYIMMVILNRMLDDDYPDTIKDVADDMCNGYNDIKPDPMSMKALGMIMVDKWDETKGATCLCKYRQPILNKVKTMLHINTEDK